jgi:signal transduction histidine kinase
MIVIAAGAAAGERLSREITKPLAQLTSAAERIAAGHKDQLPLPSGRDDEIGSLSRSFAVMSDSVRQSRQILESEIDARTTDLRRAVSQLSDAQHELLRQERLAAVGQVASSIGHELRTPLSVMSNCVQMLEMSLKDPSPQVRASLERMQAQLRLSERIISDLLDSVRSRTPNCIDVRVDRLVADQLQHVRIPPNVRVVRDIPAELPPLYVDQDQVGQILVNLLTNAVQAMEDRDGVLTVRARVTDGRMRVEVQDTGPGVSPENSEVIFEPLFTTKPQGIGLGLVISRSLARVNGGELAVANHTEGGAVFLLDLPVRSS